MPDRIFINDRRAQASEAARSLKERLIRSFGERNGFTDMDGLVNADKIARSLKRKMAEAKKTQGWAVRNVAAVLIGALLAAAAFGPAAATRAGATPLFLVQAEKPAQDAGAQAKTAEAARRLAEDRAARVEGEASRKSRVDIANRLPVPLTAAETAALKEDDEFQECAECPRMVTIPGGTFVMGSSDGKTPIVGLDGKPKRGAVADAEADRSVDEGPQLMSDEGPQHEVRIGRFAVGKFTVTFDEWEACVKGGGCKTNKTPSDENWGRGKRPVINVSWNDANDYVDWINKTTFRGRKVYRLLTEAEWEYAARARTTTRYFWGDAVIKNRANCDGCGSEWGGAKTAPVGSFPPNDFGLYDMHGNVSQWTQDCYGYNYINVPENGAAMLKTRDCVFRVIRGGSWDSTPENLRAARRNRTDPKDQISGLGFRVARTF